MENTQRQALFESVPVPRAVATLAVPTILSSLVMVLYNLADTYFVGMLNNSIQTSAVTLAAPVLLAFNAGPWAARIWTPSGAVPPSGFTAPSFSGCVSRCCTPPSRGPS